jgi:hypothetical protein
LISSKRATNQINNAAIVKNASTGSRITFNSRRAILSGIPAVSQGYIDERQTCTVRNIKNANRIIVTAHV